MAGDCLTDIDVVVLAGGLGTRIRGVLGDTPKLLAPVGGRPFLDVLVARLRAFGARRVVLGLGHLARQIEAYVAAHPVAGVELVTAVEPRPLGTAGALRFLMSRVATDPVLVMNGDSFVGVDLCDVLAAHEKFGAGVSLLAVEATEAGRFGRLDVGDGGLVHSFTEKDAGAGRGLINAGVYVFSRKALERVAAMPGSSLERDVFPKLLESGVHAVVRDAPFVDIGTPEGLAAAQVMAPFIGG